MGRWWSPRLPVRCGVCGWQSFRTGAVTYAPCPKGCVNERFGRATVKRVDAPADLWKRIPNPESIPIGYRVVAGLAGNRREELLPASGNLWSGQDAMRFASLVDTMQRRGEAHGDDSILLGYTATPVSALAIETLTLEPVRDVPLGERILRAPRAEGAGGTTG